MKIEAQGVEFNVHEFESKSETDVILFVNACKHSFQEGSWNRNPDGSLTEGELRSLGSIACEDHLEFCLGKYVVPEFETEHDITTELFGES